MVEPLAGETLFAAQWNLRPLEAEMRRVVSLQTTLSELPLGSTIPRLGVELADNAAFLDEVARNLSVRAAGHVVDGGIEVEVAQPRNRDAVSLADSGLLAMLPEDVELWYATCGSSLIDGLLGRVNSVIQQQVNRIDLRSASRHLAGSRPFTRWWKPAA